MPYVQVNASLCTNILIDDRNCGSIGTACSLPGTYCSAGVCTVIPPVQLNSYSSVWIGADNGSVDDAVYSINLPFNITLYSVTTNVVQVTTNGVQRKRDNHESLIRLTIFILGIMLHSLFN